MSEYVTEEQQVEAIKQWWKENGTSVFTGAVLGLAAVLAFRAWNDWRADRAESASVLYQQVEKALEKEDVTLIQSPSTRLREEHSSSPYVALAALAQGALLANKGELASARGQLEWAILKAPDPYLKGLAQVRLGRLLIEQTDRALELAEEAAKAGVVVESALLRADVLVVKGDRAGAKSVYQSVLGQISPESALGEEVRLKLDDLGE